MTQEELIKMAEKINKGTATRKEQRVFIRELNEAFKEMNQILKSAAKTSK